MPTAPALRRAGVSHAYQMDRNETLLRQIDAKTHHQILDLDVATDGDSVIVTGRSRTYYVKQLATQAVLTSADEVNVVNDIEVTC